MLVEILKSDGYTVHPAISAEEGITYVQSRSDISLILCDLVMPEEDGFAMLRLVRSILRFRDIPVVVCTGLPSKVSVELALKLRARECIIMPFEAESFLKRIRTIIDSGFGTLLIVTDDESVSRILTGALPDRLQNNESRSGEKSLEILSGEPVDAILTELVLTDMTGLDLFSVAQDEKTGIQALFISDPQIDASENDIVAAGGYGMLRKPFSNTEGDRKVAQLLTRVK